MNFCWITLHVNNMEESIKFYKDVIGLKISERFNIGEEIEIVMLGQNRGPKVEIICNKKQQNTSGCSAVFWFYNIIVNPNGKLWRHIFCRLLCGNFSSVKFLWIQVFLQALSLDNFLTRFVCKAVYSPNFSNNL